MGYYDYAAERANDAPDPPPPIGEPVALFDALMASGVMSEEQAARFVEQAEDESEVVI